MIPKSRLDALTDGVFSVTMTLLVIDLKLPEHFEPKTTAEFVSALVGLWPQFLVYAISFLVIGLRWWSMSRLFAHGETSSPPIVKWTLVHLFLITCVPFSTIVLGRYGGFAPAVWLYAVNMALGALVALRLVALVDAEQGASSCLLPITPTTAWSSRRRRSPPRSASPIRATRCGSISSMPGCLCSRGHGTGRPSDL